MSASPRVLSAPRSAGTRSLGFCAPTRAGPGAPPGPSGETPAVVAAGECAERAGRKLRRVWSRTGIQDWLGSPVAWRGSAGFSDVLFVWFGFNSYFIYEGVSKQTKIVYFYPKVSVKKSLGLLHNRIRRWPSSRPPDNRPTELRGGRGGQRAPA